jgi:hypothetical protein
MNAGIEILIAGLCRMCGGYAVPIRTILRMIIASLLEYFQYPGRLLSQDISPLTVIAIVEDSKNDKQIIVEYSNYNAGDIRIDRNLFHYS